MNKLPIITEYLKSHSDIRQFLVTTDSQWDAFLEKLHEQEVKQREDFYDERVWTFLFALWFASERNEGVIELTRLLTNDPNLTPSEGNKIWLEALPFSPHEKEGNTNLDLALGGITERSLGMADTREGKKGNGITYSGEDDFICFCEMKWYSDIDKSVTHDVHRNQLIRVIDNAMGFHNKDGSFPDKIYVTLVTPEIFYDRELKSRFYAYKYEEYQDKVNIIKDLEGCCLKYRNESFSKAINRVDKLRLNWVTFEDIIRNIKDSRLGLMIKGFYTTYAFKKNTTKPD